MKTQVKQRLIIIPSEETRVEVCDFVQQTQSTLLRSGYTVWRIQVFEVVWMGRNLPAFLSFIFATSQTQLTIPIFGLLPCNRWPIIRRFNSFIFIFILKLKLRGLVQCEKILWLFFPGTAGIYQQLLAVCNHTIFDIVDAFTTAPPASLKLLLKTTTVTSIGRTMKKFYQEIDPSAVISIVPQGFKVKYFGDFTQNLSQPNTPQKNLKPIITFVGGINQRLDHETLHLLSTTHPEWHFLFVGPIYSDSNISGNFDLLWWEKLRLRPNVQWLPTQPPRTINHLLKMSDVLIIPYDLHYASNRYCYPMKIFEYLASGKPIVSTPIPELENRFSTLIHFATTPLDWSRQISTALTTPISQTELLNRQRIVLGNTWDKKIAAVLKAAQLPPRIP